MAGMGNIDREDVAKAYARWAPVYDLVFGAVFERGRTPRSEPRNDRRAHPRCRRRHRISLPDYSRENRHCAASTFPSRCCARRRSACIEHNLTNVESLAVMDAEKLAFPDASFDVVVAQYVITAVPNPEGTLDDFVRVLKPGGEIILVNHIGAETGPRSMFELCFAPVARRLGWRPEFPWARLARLGARHGGVSLIERRPMPPIGHFSLIRYRKS